LDRNTDDSHLYFGLTANQHDAENEFLFYVHQAIKNMNALINLNDCKEYMIVIIDNKEYRIKLSGTIDDPYFCGKDVCEVLGYVNKKDALQRYVDDEDKLSRKELYNTWAKLSTKVDLAAQPTFVLGIEHENLTFNEGKAVYVAETGLYSLILSSQAPFARKHREEFKSAVGQWISDLRYGRNQV
jgi:prophage antirepressor-like protein